MIKSIKTYGVFLIVAIIIAAVLLSNEAGVNLKHQHNMPFFNGTNMMKCEGVFTETCRVRLTTQIGNPESYQEIFDKISNADKGDTFVFYLAGNGGQVRTVIQFYNVIKNTKAKVIMVVEGDVYSGHAMLAAMGHKLIIGDNVLFLVHTTSAYGIYEKHCNKFKSKTDRSRSSYDKCINFYKNHVVQTNSLIITLFSKYLTSEELARAISGYDVIITGEELKKRIGK